MSDWGIELRPALRRLLRARGFTAAAVTTLAIGAGAATALFTVLDAAVLRPVPYPAPDRLLSVLANHPTRGLERVSLTPADLLRLRGASGSFEQLGAYVPFGTVDWTGGGEAVRLDRFLVSEGLLEALRAPLPAGRGFRPEEYREGAPPVALVSHRLWTARLRADAAAVGAELTLDGVPHRVVGVLPADFRLPGGDPDLLLPLAFPAGAETDTGSAYLGAVGRLRDGVGLDAARAEAAVLAGSAPPGAAAPRDLTFDVRTLGELYALRARPALWALFGAVLLLLALAGANLASLQVVRAVARRGDLAVRSALGAGRRLLLRPLLAEGAVLAVAGTVAAIPCALAALHLLPDPRGVYLPQSLGLRLGLAGIAFGALATTATVALSALAAAAGVRPRPVGAALRQGAGAPQRERLLGAMVMVEVGLAFVLLLGGVALAQALQRIAGEQAGMAAERVLTVELSLPASRYADAAAVEAGYRRLLAELAVLPGVTTAAVAKDVPPASPWSYAPEVEGEQLPEGASADWVLVSPGYFAALGTPLRAGRDFTRADGPEGRRVAVVNERFARELLGGRPALDRRVGFNEGEWDIVGVVADQQAPGAVVRPTVYLAYAQTTVPPGMLRARTLVLATGGDPIALGGAVGPAIRRVDPELPWRASPLAERLDGAGPLARSRLQAAVVATFAAVALLLAVVGVAGVLAFTARRRRHEIAVRLAVGATAGGVVRLLVGRGAAWTLGGIVAGFVAAPGVFGLLARLPEGRVEADWRLLALVAGAMLAAGVLATLAPALRAGRTDPATVLRQG